MSSSALAQEQETENSVPGAEHGGLESESVPQSTANESAAAPAPAAAANENRANPSTIEDADDEDNDEERISLAQRMRDFEQRMDNISGWFVGKLASVIFYELGARTTVETIDETAVDVETVQRMIQRLADRGVNVQEADFRLKLPRGSMTAEEVAQFQTTLKETFTARQQSFQVEIRSRSEAQADPENRGTSQLTASRDGIPLVVLWLVLGASFFTLRMGFISLRGFSHAVKVTLGKYDNPEDEGEVSHFQALTAALSATVGLGNIAGVAIAISVGGPGATFWMIIAGFLGMSSKFTECTLGQMYRVKRPDGRIMGGAMFYLSNGLKDMGLVRFGKVLAVLFAILCIGGSFGGGNAFQVNQSLNAIQRTIPFFEDFGWLYGLLMTAAVGLVIIGGIRRIAATAEKIVPLMCGIYVAGCLWILLNHLPAIPVAFQKIVMEAFTPQAGYGAFLGVLVIGFKRAAFSNEAGVGSAAIAHSAARTDYPVREGIVALLEPFIDTVVICTMTALVIIITGAYENPRYADLIVGDQGAALTSNAMGEVIPWFPYVLSVAVILFAYSTMISWSYYGERCWAYLFGDQASMAYRVIFLVFVFLGSIVSSTNVKDLSDLMILGMAFPNILGLVLLSGKVRGALKQYWQALRAGELESAKQESK